MRLKKLPALTVATFRAHDACINKTHLSSACCLWPTCQPDNLLAGMRRRCSHSRKVWQQRRQLQAPRVKASRGPTYRRPTAIWMRLSKERVRLRVKMTAHKEIAPALQNSTLSMVQQCLCRSAKHSLPACMATLHQLCSLRCS